VTIRNSCARKSNCEGERKTSCQTLSFACLSRDYRFPPLNPVASKRMKKKRGNVSCTFEFTSVVSVRAETSSFDNFRRHRDVRSVDRYLNARPCVNCYRYRSRISSYKTIDTEREIEKIENRVF